LTETLTRTFDSGEGFTPAGSFLTTCACTPPLAKAADDTTISTLVCGDCAEATAAVVVKKISEQNVMRTRLTPSAVFKSMWNWRESVELFMGKSNSRYFFAMKTEKHEALD